MFRKLFGSLSKAPAPAGSPDRVRPLPEVLNQAFTDGFVGSAAEKQHVCRTIRLGDLNLSSGRVFLTDPLYAPIRTPPLELSIDPGLYPVDLVVADTGTGGHRVALARLLLSEEPAASWEIACTVGEDPATLSGSTVFTFGVDSGVAAFLDGAAVDWINEEARGAQERFDALMALTEKWEREGSAEAERLGLEYRCVLLERVGPGGMAMFSSGWGDGGYAGWVGYAEDGRPVSLVLDFAVIEAVRIPPEAAAKSR